MTESKKDTSLNKALFGIIGVLAIIILLLLGWRVAKVVVFGVELVPPATSTLSDSPIQVQQVSPPTTIELHFPLEFSVTAVGWTNTNIILGQGDKVSIEYISGQWRAASDWDWIGPKGDWRYVMSEYRLPDYPLLSFI